MFHVEMRAGMQVVRGFNLSNERLWVDYLAPLLADQDFTVQGHDFTPRKTRLSVYEGPELRPDQIGMGRGWQNVERSATDVTERVLAEARKHVAARQTTAAPTPAWDVLRERLVGRLSAGPVTFEEVVAMASDLMPESSAGEQLAAAERAALEALRVGAAQLTPSGR
jgi:hypothetical protein